MWLLRGLIECGHCHLGCNCHRMRGRNGTWHRYYYCRGHDPLRTRAGKGRCPERNIRADELDEYVFAQVRQALLDPRQLIAAERAVIAGAPADENELVAAQLKRLDSALQSNERERARLIDAYQAGLLELDELTNRTAAITARRDQLTQEKDTLTQPQRRARHREPAAPTARRLRRTDRRLARRPRHRRPPTAPATRRRESPRHRLARRDPPQDPAARRPARRRPASTRPRAEQRTVKRYAPAFPSCAGSVAWWMRRSRIAVATMVVAEDLAPLGEPAGWW